MNHWAEEVKGIRGGFPGANGDVNTHFSQEREESVFWFAPGGHASLNFLLRTTRGRVV
jgi:hypothetical protein